MNRDDVMNIFSNIIKTYNENNIGLKGMNLGFFSLYLNKLLKETDNGIIVVTPTIYEANKLYQNFSDTKDVFLYETDDVLTSLATSKSPELKVEKLNILKESLNNNKKIIITDINGYLKKLPSINDFKNNIIKLKIGTDINLKNIVDNLYEIGYEKETLVTKPGEFGVRGFILDIFPLNEENPIRIEFFGDTIESIRYFEVESQKSLENIDEIEIYSISKTSEKYSSLYEYLNNPLVILKDYSQIKISYERIMNDIFELNIENPLYDINDIDEKKINYYFDLDDDTSLAKKVVNLNIKNVERFNSNVEIINKYLEESLKFNKTVIICLSTINVNNFIEILNIPYLLTDIVNIKENNINIVNMI